MGSLGQAEAAAPLGQRSGGAHSLLAVIGLLAATLALGVSSAHAETPIEGVWSFNGGKVAIQAAPNGTFTGTVVAPTKFDQCTHPAGEQMWTEMRRQADGSYWGLHQWFFATEQCIPNPNLGPTAWRVLQNQKNESFLRACFSEPGSNSQPTISPSGEAKGATFGCVDSALISALPVVSSSQFAQVVTLPSSAACFAPSTLRIHLRNPKNDPLKTIVAKLQSGQIVRAASVRRKASGATATFDLSGLSAASFTVNVHLTTVLGDHLSGKRTYARCAAKYPHKITTHPGG